jgi:hypothetical protein
LIVERRRSIAVALKKGSAMNPTRSFALAVAAAIVALTAWAPASASSPSELRRQLTIDAALTSFDFVDLNEPGVSAGDQFVQTDTLTIDGRPAGSDLIHCVAAGNETDPGLCDAVLVVGDATLTASGRIPTSSPPTASRSASPSPAAPSGTAEHKARSSSPKPPPGYTATVDLQT